MSLTTPTLLSQVAFDATTENTFYFNVINSSSQIVSNTLTIRNNSTNTIVYQQNQQTFQYSHVLPANQLSNGTYYNATISVFDSEGNQSSNSIPIQFWCYTTPELNFNNIPTSNIINNSTYNFQFTYTQNENEPLNTYTVNLFNSSQVQISTSNEQYATSGTPPYVGNYTFTGLTNNTQYYIQVTGITIEGTLIQSTLEQFTVQYIQPVSFAILQLENNCDEGYITILSNMISIDGTSNPDPPVYIDNEAIDLTDNGSWAQWNQGFSINNNMLARIWFKNPNLYTNLIQFSNTQGQTIQLNFMLGYENNTSSNLQAYIEAYITSITGLSYYIFSNYVDQLDTSQDKEYVLYFTRNNDIYSLQLLTT